MDEGATELTDTDTVDGPSSASALASAAHDRSAMARGPFGLKPGVGALEMVAIGIVLLIPLLNLPVVDQGPWAFRTALVLVLLGPGLVLLVDLARRGDRAAQCAFGFLAVAALSAALSATPRISLIGGYGVDQGLLVLAGYAGCWAIGRRIHPDAHGPMAAVFLFAVLVSVAFGVLQVIWGLQLGILGVADGRAAGFTSSSVYLGGLVAGALGLVGYHLSTTDWRSRFFVPLLLAAAALSLGANLTGSRIALVGGVVLALAAVVRKNWRTALLLLVALAVGVGLSTLVPQSTSSTSRISSDTSSGFGSREIMWDAAAHTFVERPLLGWGPGEFRAATSPRITPAYVIGEGQDKLFFDAHDVAVEQLTTVGLIGFALLAAWIVLASRRARGPLAWIALGIAVTWLLEPVSISTAPVALLALGAATPAVTGRALGVAWRSVAAVLGLVGLVAGGLVLVATRDMKAATGRHGGSPTALAAAQRVFPRDGTLDGVAAQFATDTAYGSPTAAHRAAAIAAARKVVHDDVRRPDFWTTLGATQLQFGSRSSAEASFAQALKLDPWSESALAGMRQVGQETGDHALVTATNAKLCRIESGYCQRS